MSLQFIQPAYERRDERGVLRELITQGEWRALLTGDIHAGARMGQHYHMHTQLFFFLTSGNAHVRVIQVENGSISEQELSAGQGVIIPVMHSHRILFREESSFILLKSRPYHPDDPDTFAFTVPE